MKGADIVLRPHELGDRRVRDLACLEFRVHAVSIRLKAELVIDDDPVRDVSPDEKVIALPPLFMVEATRAHMPVGEQPPIRFCHRIGLP